MEFNKFRMTTNKLFLESVKQKSNFHVPMLETSFDFCLKDVCTTRDARCHLNKLKIYYLCYLNVILFNCKYNEI